MLSNKFTCPYCGTKFISSNVYHYCPTCGADQDEPLPEYSQAAGWCIECGQEQMTECYNSNPCLCQKFVEKVQRLY